MHHNAGQKSFFCEAFLDEKVRGKRKRPLQKCSVDILPMAIARNKMKWKWEHVLHGNKIRMARFKWEISSGIWITSEGLVCLEGWEGRRPWSIHFHLHIVATNVRKNGILMKTFWATNDENWAELWWMKPKAAWCDFEIESSRWDAELPPIMHFTMVSSIPSTG